jgi:hypothetical protein
MGCFSKYKYNYTDPYGDCNPFGELNSLKNQWVTTFFRKSIKSMTYVARKSLIYIEGFGVLEKGLLGEEVRRWLHRLDQRCEASRYC